MFKIVQSLCSVSYTHLDVYKRQTFNCVLNFINLPKFVTENYSRSGSHLTVVLFIAVFVDNCIVMFPREQTQAPLAQWYR